VHIHSFISLLWSDLLSVPYVNCISGKIGLKAELNRCITQAGYESNAGGASIFLRRPVTDLLWISS